MAQFREINLLDEKTDIDFEFMDEDVERYVASILSVSVSQGYGACPSCSFTYALKGPNPPQINKVRIDNIEFMVMSQRLNPTRQGLMVTVDCIDSIQYYLNTVTDVKIMYVSSPQNPNESEIIQNAKYKVPIRWKNAEDIFGMGGWTLYDRSGGSVNSYNGDGIVHDFFSMLNCPYEVYVDNNIPNVDIHSYAFISSANTKISDHIRAFVHAALGGTAMTQIHVWGEWKSEDVGAIYIGDAVLSGSTNKLPKVLTANNEFRMSSGGTVRKIQRARGPVLIRVGAGKDNSAPLPPCAENAYRADDIASDIVDMSPAIDIKTIYAESIDEYMMPQDDTSRQEIKQKGGSIAVGKFVKLRNGTKIEYEKTITEYGRLAGENTVKKVFVLETKREYAHIPNGMIKETEKLSGYLLIGSGSNAVPRWYDTIREVTNEFSYSKSTDEKLSGKSGTLQRRIKKKTTVKGCVGYTSMREDKDRPVDPETGKNIIIYENKIDAGEGINKNYAFQNIEEGVLIKECVTTYGVDNNAHEICRDGQTNEVLTDRGYKSSDILTHDKTGCEVRPHMLSIYLPAKESDEDGFEVSSQLRDRATMAVNSNIGFIPSEKSRDELEEYLNAAREMDWIGEMNIVIGKPVTIKEGNPCFRYGMQIDYTRPSGTTSIGIMSYHKKKPSNDKESS